ncbi:hypothetical protein ACU4GD_10365 [Cupriavidus basilensis]
MIFAAGAGIWLVFDLLLSFTGARGFTVNSTLNLALLSALTVAVAFVRRAQQFQVISLAFVRGLLRKSRLD